MSVAVFICKTRKKIYYEPFSFLDVPGDEVIVHVEQSDSDLMKDDVQSVAQRHRLLVRLSECRQAAVLREEEHQSLSS